MLLSLNYLTVKFTCTYNLGYEINKKKKDKQNKKKFPGLNKTKIPKYKSKTMKKKNTF